MKNLFQWLYGAIWRQTLRLDEEILNLALPALIHDTRCHARASALEILSLQISHQHAVVSKEQRVVVPSGFAERLQHLWPDVAMPTFVLLEPIGFHLQDKANSLHGQRRNASAKPPSTGIMCPVVFALCSLSSHTMALAQSCGRIGRLVRVRC